MWNLRSRVCVAYLRTTCRHSSVRGATVLRPLALSSDDPDYAAQLAHILAGAGSAEDSRHWRQLVAARYEELVGLHPEAFADHAANFWLRAGADPKRALHLARMNFAVRMTPRAHALLSRAVAAQTD